MLPLGPRTRRSARQRTSLALGSFLRTQELASILASYLGDRRDLAHLCQSCKAFNAIFTPFLYANVSFDGRNWTTCSPPLLEANRSLHFSRRLSVYAGDSRRVFDPPQNDILASHTELNRKVARMLAEMPNLRQLRLINFSVAGSTISKLKQTATRLDHLTIIYSNSVDTENLKAITGRRWTTAVHWNLTSLVLMNLLPSAKGCTSTLENVLLSSLNLKVLCIDFHWHRSYKYSYGHPDIDAEHVVNFLTDLCDRYAAKGGRPLHISKLGLHRGLELSADRRPGLLQQADYLGKLLHLGSLEEVDLDPTGTHDGSSHLVAWGTFSERTAPRLRRLVTNSAYLHDPAMRHWIRTSSPQFIEQLALITLENSWRRFYRSLPDIPFPSCPRMMSIDVKISSRSYPRKFFEALGLLERYRRLRGLRLAFVGEDEVSVYLLPAPLQTRLARLLATMPDLEQLIVSVPIRRGSRFDADKWCEKFAKRILRPSSIRVRHIAVGSTNSWVRSETACKFAWRVDRQLSDVASDPVLVPLFKEEVWEVELYRATAFEDRDLVTKPREFWDSLDGLVT
ncbi:hypothetical protein GQ53DRAFT_448763 [Thozetella sp. PMI_491]|nr:hypothetical protein GQ53DRAFT_448763 [Thozetella sp. PMI_491]